MKASNICISIGLISSCLFLPLLVTADGVEGAGLRTDAGNIAKSSYKRQQHVKNFPKQGVDNESGRSLSIPTDWLSGLNLFDYMEAVDETLSLGPEYTIFRNLIVAAGLEKVVQEGSLKSIFAPDNSAISAALQDFLMEPENNNLLVETVKYHLVEEPFDYLRFNTITLQNTRTLRLPTMQGSIMEISLSKEGMFINGDARIRAFMRTDDWDFLYRIDRLLPPPSMKHLFPNSILEPAYAATDAIDAFEFPILLILLDIFLPVPPQNENDNDINNFGEEAFQISDYPSLTPSVWNDSGPQSISKDVVPDAPSFAPSDYPSTAPSDAPSVVPSGYPSTVPSDTPSVIHSYSPSDTPPYVPNRIIENFQERTLLDFVSEASNLFWFGLLVEVAEMEGTLRGRGPLTVYAPNDEAFRALDRDYLGLLLSSSDYRLHAVEFVHFHLSRKSYTTTELVLEETLETSPVSSGEITVNADEDGLFFAISTEPDAPIRILEADIKGTNGWLQIIDGILKPPFMRLNPRSFLAEGQFKSEGQIFGFFTLVVAAGLEEELESAEDITLFVPMNNAITANISEFLLDPENEEYLTQTVKYHMVSNVINFENLQASTPVTFVTATEQGSEITMVQSNALYVNGAVAVDFSLVERGIIYQLDSILFPPLPPVTMQELSGDILPRQETLEDLNITKLNELLSTSGLETDSLLSEDDDRLTHLPTALMLFQNQTRSDGALTVLLPNKRAMKTVINEYGADLKKSEYKLHLFTFLAFHAAEGQMGWETLLQKGEVEMLTGDTVDVSGSRYGVFISSSAMYPARIIFSVEVESLGIVHVVTRMLLPSWTTIYDHVSLMERISSYSLFLSLVVGTGQDEILRPVSDLASEESHYDATIIAPDNNALTGDLVNYLLSPGRESLAMDIVRYHVIPELITHLAVADTERGLTVRTLQGETIDLEIINGEMALMENTTRLLAYSLTRTGILYRSEKLMIPPASRDSIPSTLLPQGTNDVPVILSDLEFPIILSNA